MPKAVAVPSAAVLAHRRDAGLRHRDASPARTAMRKNKIAPSAALEAVAAVAQPPLPVSRSTLDSAAPNQTVAERPVVSELDFVAIVATIPGEEAHMNRATLARALLVALITALVVVPGTALGAKPIAQFHDHFTDSFSTEICGIPVDAEVVVTDNFFLYTEESFKDTASVRATFTNPANGNSIIISNAGQVSGPPPIIDEEAGTITFLTNFKGLPEKIQTANGPVLLRDVGFVTFADTFDLETGDFISSEVIINNGPHPDLDSDFALFCEVVTEALA
jgi:hypothetical protein